MDQSLNPDLHSNLTPKSPTRTRRGFLQGGALLAAPLAMASAVALGGTADAAVAARLARLARLEDEAAIRRLHQSWLRRFNAGDRTVLRDDAVRRITAADAGDLAPVVFAADGRSALVQVDCAVERTIPLAADCTLAQMAQAQGHGSVCRTDRRTLAVRYSRTGDAWQMHSAALRPA